MRKFCYFIPLVESGIIVGIYGIVLWLLYFFQVTFERSLIFWRVYQVFLIIFLAITLIYDVISVTIGSDIFIYVILDVISLSLEIYFMTVVCAFQKHLEIINEPEIVYHPVNEIDDEAYINDYY